MAGHRSVGLIVLAVVVGLVLGSLLGELVADFVGPGALRDILVRGPSIGITPPATLDLRLLSLTLGITFKVNVVGILGILLALILVRRF